MMCRRRPSRWFVACVVAAAMVAAAFGAPPVQPLWANAAAYDAMNRTHGWASTWQSLSGTWASSLSYAASIDSLYDSLWTYAGMPGAGRWGPWELPGGAAANPLSADAA